jgi:hypothetical protein
MGLGLKKTGTNPGEKASSRSNEAAGRAHRLKGRTLHLHEASGGDWRTTGTTGRVGWCDVSWTTFEWMVDLGPIQACRDC